MTDKTKSKPKSKQEKIDPRDPYALIKRLGSISVEERDKVLGEMTQEQILALRTQTDVLTARTAFDAKGFESFFRVMHGTPLHRTAKDEWVPKMFQAHTDGRGYLLKCHREGAKSTVFRFFLAFAIGHMPERVHGIARLNDEKGHAVAKAIAAIIETDVRWSWIFPHVTPSDRAWGAEGYDVVSTEMEGKRITPDEWASWMTKRPDGNTFVGRGYKSGSWIGSRFNGVFLFDDILDARNTDSVRAMGEVETVVMETIEYTFTKDAIVIWAYTPWLMTDIYAIKENSGEYIKSATPVMEPAKEGDEGATYWEPTPLNTDYPDLGDIPYSGKWWVLHWKEQWDFDRIASVYRRSSEKHGSFERMMMLDLAAMSGQVLKREWLHEYPAADISPSWPVFFGIDYASTSDKLKQRRRDYFVIAIWRQIPGGGLILVDGTRERFSKGEALDRTAALAGLYPTLQLIGVEAIGKGEEFANDLVFVNTSLGTPLPLFRITSHSKSKGARFEDYLAPRFKFGQLWITDTPTPFIRAFVDEWVAYPGPFDDMIDAADMGVRAAEKAGAVYVGSNNRGGQDSSGASKHPLIRMRESVNAR